MSWCWFLLVVFSVGHIFLFFFFLIFSNSELHLGHYEQFIIKILDLWCTSKEYWLCFSRIGSSSKSFFPVVTNLNLYSVFSLIWDACSLFHTCLFQGSARDLGPSLHVDFGPIPLWMSFFLDFIPQFPPGGVTQNSVLWFLNASKSVCGFCSNSIT